jgi:hypothetical protein
LGLKIGYDPTPSLSRDEIPLGQFTLLGWRRFESSRAWALGLDLKGLESSDQDMQRACDVRGYILPGGAPCGAVLPMPGGLGHRSGLGGRV